MRQNGIFAFSTLFLLCGAFFHPICAMDTKQMLQEADAAYATESEPEKALELYAAIIADGTDEVGIILSKLKTAYIYDEQLMQYDKAFDAYKQFAADYPDNRLTKIIKSKIDRFETLYQSDELDVYSKFKKLQTDRKKLGRLEMPDMNAMKKSALDLAEFAKLHHTTSFADEMLYDAVTSLAQHRLYFKVYKMLGFIEKNRPEHFTGNSDYALVRLGIVTAAAVMTAKIMIGLCVVFVLTGRGFKRAWMMAKHSWKRLLAATAILFVYMIGYSAYVMTKIPDAYMSKVYLYAALIECALLLPFALLLYNSFPYIKEGRLKSILTGIICTLLALSGWILFAHRFGFILEMLSETL